MSAVTSSSSAAQSSSKAGTAGSSSASSGSVTKRLRSELMSLMMAGIPGVSAFPESDSDLTKWLGTIKGPEGTPYSGLSFKLSISFPQDYPLSAPTIKFLTPCFHPNVALPGGDICLDILKEEWSSIYTIQTILISLQSLLGEPNNNSPLNVDASQLWGNEEAFKSQVQRSYKA